MNNATTAAATAAVTETVVNPLTNLVTAAKAAKAAEAKAKRAAAKAAVTETVVNPLTNLVTAAKAAKAAEAKAKRAAAKAEAEAAAKAEAEAKAKILIDVTTLVVKKEIGKLTAAKESLKESLKEVRSFSSYFKELRKNHTKVATLLTEVSRKGIAIDTALVHRIINLGETSPILKTVEQWESKNGKLSQWTESRIIAFFVSTVVIPKVKK